MVEVGGGLRTYTLGGVDVLDGYGPEATCSGARGQVLLPWPNRIRDGRYESDGRTQQLALSEPERHNAIHGLVRWLPWVVREKAPQRVVVEQRLYPQPGYPFRLDLRIEYELSDAGQHVRTTAHNAGPTGCPFGAGAHPYLTVGTVPVDDGLRLLEPGESWTGSWGIVAGSWRG